MSSRLSRLRASPWFTLALGLVLTGIGVAVVRDGNTLGGTFLLLIGLMQFPLAAHQTSRLRLTAYPTVLAVAGCFLALGVIALIDTTLRTGGAVSTALGLVAACVLLGVGLWMFVASRRVK